MAGQTTSVLTRPETAEKGTSDRRLENGRRLKTVIIRLIRAGPGLHETAVLNVRLIHVISTAITHRRRELPNIDRKLRLADVMMPKGHIINFLTLSSDIFSL